MLWNLLIAYMILSALILGRSVSNVVLCNGSLQKTNRPHPTMWQFCHVIYSDYPSHFIQGTGDLTVGSVA